MSRFVTLNWFIENMFIQVIVKQIIGEFKQHWYVELDKLTFNLYLYLYFYSVEEETSIIVGMITSISVIKEGILHVQLEFVEKHSFFLLKTNLLVCNYHPNLMKRILPVERYNPWKKVDFYHHITNQIC